MPEADNVDRAERWEDQMDENGGPEPPALTARKRLCYDIAEGIEEAFDLEHLSAWDLDVAARIVDAHLPLTHVEAAEEWDKLGGDHG